MDNDAKITVAMTVGEAKGLIRVVLQHADFKDEDEDFTDSLNSAIDACYRTAALLVSKRVTGISKKTLNVLSIRQKEDRWWF